MARFIVPNGCSDKHIRWFVFSLSGFRKNFTTFFFHNAIFFLFCFFRFLPFCFQPSFTRFLQLVFCKINLFPFFSDDEVKTSVKYGNSVKNCDMTTSQNYVEEGHYPVYYEINYMLGMLQRQKSEYLMWGFMMKIQNISAGVAIRNADAKILNAAGTAAKTSAVTGTIS